MFKFFLVGCMMFLLVGCGSDNENNESVKNAKVEVPTENAVVPEYVTDIDISEEIKHANGDKLLLQNQDGLFLYDMKENKKVLISNSYILSSQFQDDKILFIASTELLGVGQIYLWNNGVISNISKLANKPELSANSAIIRDNWIAWSFFSSNTVFIYNIQTQEYYEALLENEDIKRVSIIDMLVLPDTVRLYMEGNKKDIFSHITSVLQYDMKTQHIDILADNDLRNTQIKIKQPYIAWLSGSPSYENPFFTLNMVSSDNLKDIKQFKNDHIQHFWLGKETVFAVEPLTYYPSDVKIHAYDYNGVNIATLPTMYAWPLLNIDDSLIYLKDYDANYATTWVWKKDSSPAQLWPFAITNVIFDEGTQMLYFKKVGTNAIYRVKWKG